MTTLRRQVPRIFASTAKLTVGKSEFYPEIPFSLATVRTTSVSVNSHQFLLLHSLLYFLIARKRYCIILKLSFACSSDFRKLLVKRTFLLINSLKQKLTRLALILLPMLLSRDSFEDGDLERGVRSFRPDGAGCACACARSGDLADGSLDDGDLDDDDGDFASDFEGDFADGNFVSEKVCFSFKNCNCLFFPEGNSKIQNGAVALTFGGAGGGCCLLLEELVELRQVGDHRQFVGHLGGRHVVPRHDGRNPELLLRDVESLKHTERD